MEKVMDQQKRKTNRKWRRAIRQRNRIRAAGTRVRLSVHRTKKHISAQIIDDKSQKTLCAVTTVGKANVLKDAGNVKGAQAIGKRIAELAIKAGITEVAFDRGHYKYHGRVKALADAAREAGLKF